MKYIQHACMIYHTLSGVRTPEEGASGRSQAQEAGAQSDRRSEDGP
jgi:hypothetical protein